MKNFEIEKDGKKYWISRSVAVSTCVFAIVNGKLSVLANKRGPGLPSNVGKWNCPGGYLDYDETLKEAACREIKEETGVEIRPADLQLVEIDSNPGRGAQTVLLRYFTQLKKESHDKTDYYDNLLTSKYSEPNEVAEIKWISIDELDNYEWVSDQHKKVIIKYSHMVSY